MTFFWHMCIALAILFIASPIHAAEGSLDPRLCQALVKHVPDADVTYQPGIDVHGKPVAPADLPGTNAFELRSPITIPLTADLLKILHISATNFPFNTMGRTDINLGTLIVEGDLITYNGQPLTDEQQDNLSVICMDTGNK